ncbi:alpha/beta fold hydrolase [Salininema proteolyticum]|uniref:Alpha/beta fold hydrolase n=1 Tax=Salininema proteolyticum TaxID=1607685 RepID=A0ABV8U0X1_9ACTN
MREPDLDLAEQEMVAEGCPNAQDSSFAKGQHLSRSATGRSAAWSAASRQLAATAEQIADTSKRLNSLLAEPRVRRAMRVAPGPTSRFAAALSRILVGKSRLGCVPHGGRFARTLAAASAVTGRNSLASHVAALALRLRIFAVAEMHPELYEDPQMTSMIAALSAGKQLEALQIFRSIKAERGTAGAMSDLAPVFTELTALLAMLDNNPFNDAVAWSFTTGNAPKGEPLLGVSTDWIAGFERGEGKAVQVDLDDDVKSRLHPEFGVEARIRDIGEVREWGYVLVQHIDCEDGKRRYVFQLPGMTADEVSGGSTQDLLGAIRNCQFPDSTYTRALKKTVAAQEIPEGAEIALIGHSQGGLVAMNLAEDEDFTSRFTVTHVVAVGSPVDTKDPDPSVWCASVTNQHDLVPSLDGRGPGSPFNPHPEWYEVDFADPSHGFPACHHAFKYADNLRDDVPFAAARIDGEMARYRGRIARTTAWILED